MSTLSARFRQPLAFVLSSADAGSGSNSTITLRSPRRYFSAIRCSQLLAPDCAAWLMTRASFSPSDGPRAPSVVALTFTAWTPVHMSDKPKPGDADDDQ